MSRLNRIHVAVIALIIFAGLAAAFLMVLIRPHKEEIAKLQTKIDQQQAVADTRPKVQTELDQAKAARIAAVTRWNSIMDAKMSQISLADPYKAMFAIYKENQTYSDQIITALNANKDVQYTGGAFNFPFTGWSPPIGAAVRRQFNQGGLTLQATNFRALLDWLKTTDKLPRVMLLGDTITISRTSSGLTVSTPVTFYIDFKDARAPLVTKQAAAAAPAQGATAGIPQRMGGPMPGRRPMGK